MPEGLRLGVRTRTTLIAVLVVAVVLVAGTLVFLWATESRLEDSIRDAAAARAETIVTLLEAGVLADPPPGGDPELLAQVLDEAGRVVGADPALGGSAPVSDVRAAPGERVSVTLSELAVASPIADDPPFVVVAEGYAAAGRTGVVLVAASLEDAAEVTGAALPVLGLGLPGLLAVVALITWISNGRALRPMDEMRAEAARISAAALDRRLPVPGSGDELHRLAVTLNEMLDRLDGAARRQSRFVADASHELRSPLASLRAMVDAADPLAPPQVQAALLADIGAELDRMQRLVTDLLFLAREQESPTARLVEVDVDQVVRAVAAELRRRGAVDVDTAAVEPVRVLGDPGSIERMVRNLAENAERHAAGRVWLAVAEDDGRATIRVGDDGPGIPESERERVFERFVRLDEGRSRGEGGAGLGLAVVRSAARRHGGEASVVPSARGATLEVRLPLG